MRPIVLALIAIPMILGSTAVRAGDGHDQDCPYTPRAEWKAAKDIADKARADGLTVLDIHADDGCWRVKALDKDRYKVKATYDPKTGELLWMKHD